MVLGALTENSCVHKSCIWMFEHCMTHLQLVAHNNFINQLTNGVLKQKAKYTLIYRT